MARVKIDTTNDIFEWNKKKALAHLLAMEEHLNELSEEDVPHSWCSVKHYLQLLYHHVSEAVTHAERLGLDPAPFRNFRNELMKLKVYPVPHVTEQDIAKLRSEWRRIIGDPTLTSGCPLCSGDVTPEVLEKLEAASGKKQSPEEALKSVASLFEAKGQPVSEKLSFSHVLNTEVLASAPEGKTRMVERKVMMGIYGASIGAKVVEIGLEKLDAVYTVPVLPAPLNKPSVLGKVAIGVGTPLYLLLTKKTGGKLASIPWLVFAAHVASGLVDDAIAAFPVTGVSVSRNYGVRQIMAPVAVGGPVVF